VGACALQSLPHALLVLRTAAIPAGSTDLWLQPSRPQFVPYTRLSVRPAQPEAMALVSEEAGGYVVQPR